MNNPRSTPHFIRIPLFEMTDSDEFDFNTRMQLIAERYAAEEHLLAAVASGDEQAVFTAFREYGELMQDPQQEASPTSDDELRDFKNSVLSINTLFRKAIEGNFVHPIYIHESSSYFGAAIEKAETVRALKELIPDMVHVYCHLVRECSLASYSPVIRKALLFIDMNLASPISTKDIAEDQFLTPNYLSARFRHEVGVSISDYLLNRRVRLACRLLSTTQFSVQEIASKTGIGDASYFSRQFKRIIGLPPLQYRKKPHIDKDPASTAPSPVLREG